MMHDKSRLNQHNFNALSEQKYLQRASKSTTELIERGNRFRKVRINVFST